MESAMDSRSAAAAAAAPLPLYPPALLSLPDLDRPPAIMEIWELEAVAAALPAKKRRLRETFDRLAAFSPTPLPFRWEDLDTYISSLQYSVTLRRRQLRELEKSKPAPALAPAPAPIMSLAPVTGAGGDVGQVQVLEKPRPAPALDPVLPAVSAPPATDGDAPKFRALVKSKRIRPQPPSPAPAAAAVSAPAATAVQVEEGRKRKAPIQEAEEVHVTLPTTHTQEGQAEMQRSRPPRPVPASVAAASAAAVTGRDPEKSKKRKVPSLEAEAASQKAKTQHAGREVERRHESHDSVVTTKNIPSHDGGEAKVSPRCPGPGSGSGLPITAVTTTAQVDGDPICQIGGIRQEPRATITQTVSLPEHKQVVPSEYEVPDVEMERVQPEEMPQVLKDDASMVAKKARQTQVIKSEEADKVSPLPLDCSSGHAKAGAGAGAATAMPQVAAAAGASATVCKSSPTVTRDTPNLVRASAPAPAPKSAGGVAAASRHASASHATRPAPPAAGSQQDASDVSPVPPRGGNGLARSSSRLSAGAGMQAVSARESAVVRQGSPVTGMAPAPPARHDLSATSLVVPASRRGHTGLSEASAHRNAGKHVLQQQHMPKQHEPISSLKKQQEWSSRNHGGRPTGSRPVPEAQRSWSRPGEGGGGGLPAARGLPGDRQQQKQGQLQSRATPIILRQVRMQGPSGRKLSHSETPRGPLSEGKRGEGE